MMYDHEKSDSAIVAVKPTNKAGQPAAELVEPRAGAEGNVSKQSTGRAQNGVSCRMFLCGCCRSQVFVCRCCDRGQVYCIETCAQKARHDRQREARRRYQATPRGRAMHAERNRRYRARMRCVTDHDPAKEPEGRPSLNLDVGAALSQPALSRKSPGLSFCDNCGRSASAFLRRSALRTRLRHADFSRNVR
jgi:hypothetical protein